MADKVKYERDHKMVCKNCEHSDRTYPDKKSGKKIYWYCEFPANCMGGGRFRISPDREVCDWFELDYDLEDLPKIYRRMGENAEAIGEAEKLLEEDK